jgi:CPA1 family monovalent cation:H+ antiporter
MTVNLLDTATVLVVLAAVFAYVNYRFLTLPFSIGLVVSALVSTIALLGIDALFPSLGLAEAVRHLVRGIDFTEALMHGMLGFLLFAGALHVNLDHLFEAKLSILMLATVGVILSTAIVGVGSYGLFRLAGFSVPFTYCLVFGALISPTDPVAVLGILESMGAPKALEVRVAGESLFNDGVGVIVFTVLLGVAGTSAHGPQESAGFDLAHVAAVFGREVLGGMVLGLALGLIAFGAMRSLEEANLEILFSVALVLAIGFTAEKLHTSSPLASVVAGLLIGNHGRRMAMGDEVRHALDLVWSFLDEALNGILFLLVGLEVLAISLAGRDLVAALLAIPLSLGARFISVGAPIAFMRRHASFTPGAVRVLTWGGLKGGISVALALSLPHFPGREAVLTATYAVVIFSIVVQGITIRRVVASVTGTSASAA